jgi:hypothetical protein
MLSLVVWVLGLLLMAVLLVRACEKTLLRSYPLFYLYLSFILLKSSCLLWIYLKRPSDYGRFYWYIDPASSVLGCAVVWEIYRGALGRFPGAARMARNVLLLLLAAVLSKVISDTSNGIAWWPSGTLVELERNLRAVQAAVLIVLVGIIALYRIPVSRNVWGMMLGYGLFVGTNVIVLTLRVLLGNSFQEAWHYLQPLSYVSVLGIWCATLWSYLPLSVGKTNPKIEEDYQLLVRATRKGFLEARTYLRKALRP